MSPHTPLARAGFSRVCAGGCGTATRDTVTMLAPVSATGHIHVCPVAWIIRHIAGGMSRCCDARPQQAWCRARRDMPIAVAVGLGRAAARTGRISAAVMLLKVVTATASDMRRTPHDGRVVRYANIHYGTLGVMERFVMTQTRHIDAGISEYISTGYIGLPAVS